MPTTYLLVQVLTPTGAPAIVTLPEGVTLDQLIAAAGGAPVPGGGSAGGGLRPRSDFDDLGVEYGLAVDSGWIEAYYEGRITWDEIVRRHRERATNTTDGGSSNGGGAVDGFAAGDFAALETHYGLEIDEGERASYAEGALTWAQVVARVQERAAT